MQFQVVERLGVVRTPILDKIAQHRRIEPSAAAGAALEHDIAALQDRTFRRRLRIPRT